MLFVPTDEQTRFIEEPLLEVVLTACPGSGKTHSAVQRFIERCKIAKGYGVAFLSYTNVAVDEAHRIARENGAGGLVGHPNIISTIDAFFQNYIFTPFAAALIPGAVTPTEIIDEERGHSDLVGVGECNVSKILPNLPGKAYGPPLEAWKIRGHIPSDGSFAFDYASGWQKGRTAVARDRWEAVWAAKIQYIQRGLATFDDILLVCRALLKSCDYRIAEIIAHRFGEMIVDEAQDTSRLQQELLQRIARAGAKISYVGDPKQGIYGFNGANAQYLKDLVTDGHREHELTENRRSIRAIVEVVNSRFESEMTHIRETKHRLHGAYLVVGSEEVAVASFEAFIGKCGIDEANAVAIARNKSHLGSTLRTPNTQGWRAAYRNALDAWQRERRHEVEAALRAAVRLMKNVMDPTCVVELGGVRLKEVAWTFIRGESFPTPTGESPAAWSIRLKDSLMAFLDGNGLKKHAALGARLSKAGIPDKGSALEKLSFDRPRIRTTVIHRVKGESISAVLVVAPKEQHDAWLGDASTAQELEELNICYVAFTRAANLLVLHCPNEIVAERWRAYGFADLPS